MKRLDMPEGYIANRWMKGRFQRNKNILIATIGATGSGKSYCNLRMLELWYEYYFKKKMPIENVCFSIKEAMQLISTNKLPKGSLLVVEEAGVIMNSLDFQNRLVKFFGFVLQSFRSKNIGIIFNLPHLNFMTKTSRTLLHGIFQTMKIDTSTKEVVVKPFFVQVNPLTGKLYRHYLKQKVNNRYVKVKRVSYSLPSPNIIKEYEAMKDEFVNKTSISLVDEINKIEDKDKKPVWTKEQVIELYNAGYNTPTKFVKAINPELKSNSLNRDVIRWINELNQAKMLRKAKLFVKTTNLQPA